MLDAVVVVVQSSTLVTKRNGPDLVICIVSVVAVQSKASEMSTKETKEKVQKVREFLMINKSPTCHGLSFRP
jgi:hypothetical protein